jgi:FkbM family methyltransferase
MPDEFISYASNLEDVLLARVFRNIERGFYIDVGANDPTTESLTKVFYDRGWHGINVEPIPRLHERLTAERSRDANLRLALCDKPGELSFHEVVGAPSLSSMVESVAAEHRKIGYTKRKTYTVAADTLAHVCEQHVNGDIHFLKIDVEGGEASVLRGTDFKRYRPWVVVIEATIPNTSIPTHQDWEPLLLAAGYQFAAFDGCNRFYVAYEHQELLPAFSIPVDIYKRHSSQIAEDVLKRIGRLVPFRSVRKILRYIARL